jgi:hypothetical protein
LRKLGARNIQAGVGCGVGFGHGFGVGIAVKPSAIHKLQASIMVSTSLSKSVLINFIHIKP